MKRGLTGGRSKDAAVRLSHRRHVAPLVVDRSAVGHGYQRLVNLLRAATWENE